jgi:signal transduction histidine kinase
LAAAYYTEGNLTPMNFLINLDIASQVSQSDAVICNAKGMILLCSDSPFGCSHQGLSVGSDYLQKVSRSSCVRDTGTIKGLYTDSRYICSVPIHSPGGALVGIAIVSQTAENNDALLGRLTEIYVSLSVLTIVIAALFTVLWVKKQNKPLREMAKTAHNFGHGDLDARVEIRKNYTSEVEELALSFNNMASSLQKGEYQRQEFVANVSHELKTPMTTIGGYIDGILDGTIPEEKSHQYMRVVSDEIKRLSRLVRSMLDISQLQQEQGIPEEKKIRFDLEECAGQVLITFEQKITSKNLEVEVEMPEHPVYIHANQDYITQVIYNLVDNAVKFCPPGGTLGLRIREGGSKAYVSIYNDGQTIPPEELPLVFDRFHKIDKSRSQHREGWGLGLYIVKTIVCSHGENISVSSSNGRTEFIFTMPLIL